MPLFPRSSHWPRINPVVPSQAPSIYYPLCIQVLWYKFTSLHCSTPTPTEIYIFCSTCARAVRSYLVISSFTKNSQTSFNSFSTVQEPIHVTRYQEKNCNSWALGEDQAVIIVTILLPETIDRMITWILSMALNPFPTMLSSSLSSKVLAYIIFHPPIIELLPILQVENLWFSPPQNDWIDNKKPL